MIYDSAPSDFLNEKIEIVITRFVPDLENPGSDSGLYGINVRTQFEEGVWYSYGIPDPVTVESVIEKLMGVYNTAKKQNEMRKDTLITEFVK